MIKNDRQLKITKDTLQQFEDSLTQVKADNNVDKYLKEMQLNAINNDIQQFRKEIAEYERLKTGTVNCLHLSFKHAHEALIKARIAKGWSQADLAKKINVKEQQIQRYEATNYSAASQPRMNEIVYALGININLYVTGLAKHKFNLPEGFTEEQVWEGQTKIKQKRSLFQLAQQ